MIYGYARVSTAGQATYGNSLEEQKQNLLKNGCQEIIEEHFTGKTIKRPEFTKLLKKLQPNDTLMVTKLDRIARSVGEGNKLIQDLMKKNINVHIINMGLLDNTPQGKLIARILLTFSEFERDMIIERTQAGKAIARQKPGFKEGRPRIKKSRTEHALDLIEKQNYTYKQAAEETGISVPTLVRRARERKLEKLNKNDPGLL